MVVDADSFCWLCYTSPCGVMLLGWLPSHRVRVLALPKLCIPRSVCRAVLLAVDAGDAATADCAAAGGGGRGGGGGGGGGGGCALGKMTTLI